MFSAKDIAYIGIMIALVEASKFALSSLPNIELTSFWLIMFTLYYGRKTAIIVPVLILVEGAVYGVNTWWIMYLYIWPLLVLITWIFRKTDSAIFWAIVSGIFGLCFGGLCSLTYLGMGIVTEGFKSGANTAFSFWISGLYWDMIHCVGNFVLMLVLYKPVGRLMKREFLRIK